MSSTITAIYWFILIEICRLLLRIGAGNFANKLADVTGLKRRLIELIEEYSPHRVMPAGTPAHEYSCLTTVHAESDA